MVLRKFVSLLFGIALLSCESSPAVQADGTPDAGRLYNIHCASCHKPDGTGGIAGAKSLVHTTLDQAGIQHVIRKGQGDMMPFESLLSDAEMAAVATYADGFKKHK